jgi:carbamate kinase
MAPKVEAACDFVAGATARAAVITALERASEALSGAAGALCIVP